MAPSLGRRLLGNLSAQGATFVVSSALGLITTMVLARRLGPDGFGGFTFLFSFIYFFQTINDLGINTALVRDLAKAPERATELVQHMLGFKLVLALASMVVAWVAAATWPDLTPDVRRSVTLFALILPIQAMGLPFVTMQARIQVGRASTIEVLNRVIGFAGMMTALMMGYGLLGVTAGLLLGEVASLIAVLATTHGIVAARPEFNVATWMVVLRSSVPLGMAGLLVSLVNRADFLLLQLMLGDHWRPAVAYYGTAYRVTNLVEKLPLFVMTTLYPIMSRLVAEDPVALAALYTRSVRYLTWSAVVVTAIVIGFAPAMMSLLGGGKYAAAVLPLRILVLSSACLYPAVVAGNLLIALGKTQRSLWIWTVAAPVNIVLNFFLIPRFEVAGAAAATVVSFAIVLVGSLVMARRDLNELLRNMAPDRVL